MLPLPRRSVCRCTRGVRTAALHSGWRAHHRHRRHCHVSACELVRPSGVRRSVAQTLTLFLLPSHVLPPHLLPQESCIQRWSWVQWVEAGCWLCTAPRRHCRRRHRVYARNRPPIRHTPHQHVHTVVSDWTPRHTCVAAGTFDFGFEHLHEFLVNSPVPTEHAV